jgi:hypothetical protein
MWELRMLSIHSATAPGLPPLYEMSESAVLNIVRAEATRKGLRLWRNNVGACYTARGDFIRYGLANGSAAENSIVKSADLIGIRPIVITQQHIGYTIGQFVSREIKAANWRYTGTEREAAQLRWAELILALGGDSGFTTAEGSL